MTALIVDLRQLGACREALDWVGERDLATAWRECERGDWMMWWLRKSKRVPLTHPAWRQIAADCAERVLHLLAPTAQSACARAIDAARRGDHDECRAAYIAAYATAHGAHAANAAVAAVAYTSRATVAKGAHADAANAARAAADAYTAIDASTFAVAAVVDAAVTDAAVYALAYAAAVAAERRAQADIVRRYFPVPPSAT